MTIRYYILPIEVNPIGARRPKYFRYRGETDNTLLNDPWSMKDYGSINECVICTDITSAHHTTLSGYSDVLSLPINIDNTLTTGAVNTAKNFLESYNVPAGWINAGQTYREVLRTITAFFLYVQRVNGILGRDIVFPDNWLNIQFGNLSTELQNAMVQAAQEQGFSTTNLKSTTTIRAILKYMADEWGDRSIYFGSLATL